MSGPWVKVDLSKLTLGYSLGLLSGEPGSGYQADIVFGTPDQFTAARDASPLPRGRLVIYFGVPATALQQEMVSTYLRVLSA